MSASEGLAGAASRDAALPLDAPIAAAERPRFPIVHLILFVATLATTTIAGALNANVPWEELDERWAAGLPFSLSLMGILLCHEMGHYLCARAHGVRATLPFFLPAPPWPFLIGTFGAFIRLRSLPPSRRALFDVGAAGPWAGFLVALPVAWVGLELSEIQRVPPTFAGLYFGDSLLFKGLSWLVVGPVPYGFDVFLHPVGMAGWFGLFVTGLNLLPIGQLDGGHVIYALFGRGHRYVARGFLLTLLALGFLGWAGWFLWAILVTVAGIDHPPTTDRETPLDPRRRVAAWATLALFVVTLVPVPIAIVEGGVGAAAEDLLQAMLVLP